MSPIPASWAFTYFVDTGSAVLGQELKPKRRRHGVYVMRAFQVALLALVAVTVSTVLTPMPRAWGQYGTASVCNKTSSTINLAVAYYWYRGFELNDLRGPATKSWFRLDPGQCSGVFPSASADGHRWYYAESGAGLWKGTANFCVRDPNEPKAFTSDTTAFANQPEFSNYPPLASPPCRAPFVERGFRVLNSRNLDLAE